MTIRCLCEACSPDAPGPTYTRRFMHECEVRWVAALSSDDARSGYLAGVASRRGGDAMARLRKDVWALIKSNMQQQPELFA